MSTKSEELKSIFDQFGVKGLNDYAKEKLEEWKSTPVNLAVVGNSGVGKSSFINKIRDMTVQQKHPEYAPTDVVQSTMKPTKYEFPDNKLIHLWDIPGAGTKEFSMQTYAKDMHFEKYDAFIILSADRFTENDGKIAQKIKDIGKPFYFGRTKMDQVMKNEQRERGDQFSETGTNEKIISDCHKNLGKAYEDNNIYLLCYEDEDSFITKQKKTFTFQFPDNENIKIALVKDLPDKVKAALVLSMAAKSKELIAEKVRQLQVRMIWLSLVSGACGAVPVPGISLAIDLNIVAAETKFQIKQLGIDGDAMSEKASVLGITSSQFHERIKSVAARDGYFKSHFYSIITNLIDFLQTYSGKNKTDDKMLLLLKLPAMLTAFAAEEAAESGMKLIPIFGSTVAGIMSATCTATMLKLMLNGNVAVAKASLVVSAGMEEKAG